MFGGLCPRTDRGVFDGIRAGSNIKKEMEQLPVDRLSVPSLLLNIFLLDDEYAATKTWHGQDGRLANDVNVSLVERALVNFLRVRHADLIHPFGELLLYLQLNGSKRRKKRLLGYWLAFQFCQ